MDSNFSSPAASIWSRGRVILTVATIAYALVFILVLIIHANVVGPAESPGIKLFSNLGQLIAETWASGCAFYLVAHTQREDRSRWMGWLLIAAGSASYTLGQAMFMYYDLRGIDPFPTLADVSFTAAYPFLLAGATLLFGAIPLAGRLRHLLDSAIAASGVGVISWYFVIEPLWAQSDPDLTPLAKGLGIFYPLADVALCFGAAALLNGSWSYKRLRLPYALLAAGAIMFALTDTMWNFYTIGKTYHTGSWIDPGWPIGYLLISYAALLTVWQSNNQKEQVPLENPYEVPPLPDNYPLPKSLRSAPLILIQFIVPYIIGTVAFIIVATFDYNSNKNHIISTSTYVSGFWLMFLVILRQVMTMFQNQHLTYRLQVFNFSLEQTVAQRTHQINSLLELTKAVNNTLQASDVLESALVHTRQTLSAEAVALRLCSAGDCAKGANFLEVGLEDKPEVSSWIKELELASYAQSLQLPEEEGLAVLRAPLTWRDTSLGDICVVRSATRSFSKSESEMLESIGIEVAAAYQNAQTHAIALDNADRDSVTGLLNHRAIHERLQTELDRAGRNQRPLAVIMMDLNNFKLFNDTYGHPVGDQVLKRVASALESKCRKFDVLGRYGGDEFIAVLPETDLPLAMVVAQRWRERMELEGFNFAGDEERTIPVSLSFGIATYPSDSTNRFELVSIADANLYSAKLSEKGIVATSETQRQNRQLKTESSFDVLDAMVTAVDNKDAYTRRHSEDVTDFALWIAEELGLSQATQRVVRLAGLLHDVGKIGVPEQILRKPGRLTNEEFDVMKQHSQFGAFIVGGVPGMEEILPGVKSHHERYDGRGYPDGLAGEAIPFLGRLLAVADACSAMTTSRPYRQALEWGQALKEIEANIGTQFDPQMARAFLRAARKKRADSKDTSYAPRLQLVEGTKANQNLDSARSGKSASS